MEGAIFSAMPKLNLTYVVCCSLPALVLCLPAYSWCLDSFDLRILEWTRESRNEGVHDFMENLSEAWNPENLIMASLPIVFYCDERAFSCMELAWKSMLISESTTATLKFVTNRPRPDGREHSRVNSSFPSSHASSSFAVAYSVSRYYPRWSIPAYGTAALISYSRIYLDAHHTSDVIAGAAIGLLGGYLTDRYLKSWHIDRCALVSSLPVRVQVTDGNLGVRIHVSRKF